jgi:hypothetical protein
LRPRIAAGNRFADWLLSRLLRSSRKERDLAIRLLDAGYEILFGDSPLVVHNRSPKRDVERMNYYGIRNTLLFDILNIPLPHLVPHFTTDAITLFFYKLTWRSAPTRLEYVLSGLLSSFMYWRLRKPVRRETYKRYRGLPTHGPLPFSSYPQDNVFRHT